MSYAHPARQKRCAFCNRWTGNANLKFKNPAIGFEFDRVTGKCAKNNGFYSSITSADRCEYYDPNMEARKLL